MKVVILAGGLGTRISEESHLRPKPMIEIDGLPILWHIMKYYSYYGFDDFVICCGYKGYVIKQYFADYYIHRSDVTFDFRNNNDVIIHNNVAEPWKVTIVDTGKNAQTGCRIKRIQKYVEGEQFMLTYGDGVSDVDLSKLLKFHNENKKVVTMTAVQLRGRFGVLKMDENCSVSSFVEKSKEDGGWINGGFMVVQPEIFNYLSDDEQLVFERAPLERLAKDGKLGAYRHNGFWKCMDTLRDKEALEYLLKTTQAPWVKW